MRSTRFTRICTAQTSVFQKVFVKLFRIILQKLILQKFVLKVFELFSLIFPQIFMKFCPNFADVLGNVEIELIFQKFSNYLELSQFQAKIPEFFEF